MGKVNYSSIIQPLPGQSFCGDIAWIKLFNRSLLSCLIDVAGHGYEAHAHAEQCIHILEQYFTEDLLVIVSHLNEYSLGKKPLVIGITVIDIDSGLIKNVTVGNIVTRIIGKQGYRFFSPSGMVGRGPLKPQLQEYLLNNEDILLMYSDGVSNRFEKNNYPEIVSDSIDLIPDKIIQLFSKKTDDASCIAVRYNA